MKTVIIGYVQCDNCREYVDIDAPQRVTIWSHPDDPKALASVACPQCEFVTTSPIESDHLANFQKKGCVVKPYSDRFEPLTEKAIDEWDFDADYEQHFG